MDSSKFYLEIVAGCLGLFQIFLKDCYLGLLTGKISFQIFSASLGLCDFAWPIMDSMNTFDYVGDPNLEAQIFQAVTGVDGKQLELFAERIFNQQRAIMVGEGRRVPEDDKPPEYNFTVPTETESFVPGYDGKQVSTLGSILDKEKFKEMMSEYYQLRGWENTSGLPYRNTLINLDIEDLAVTFEAAGYQLPT